jgi:hypothetical protein
MGEDPADHPGILNVATAHAPHSHTKHVTLEDAA